MRGRKRGNRTGRFWAAAALAALPLSSGMAPLGCRSLEWLADPSRSPAPPSVLEGTEIELISTRFAPEPRDLYTRGSRFLLRASFDPVLVELERLSAWGLWVQRRPGGDWSRVGSFRTSGGPLTASFSPKEDGSYGLRASAVYDDGRERLQPRPGDSPLVWIHVDRSPPRLTWAAPPEPVKPGARVALRWSASEMRFGEVPAVIEWSLDGGATWKPIDRVRPGRGEKGLRWRVPREAAWTKPLLRITAWDLVGNRAASILPLEIEPPGASDLASRAAESLTEEIPSRLPPEQAASAPPIAPAGVERTRALAAVVPSTHREEEMPLPAEPVVAGPPRASLVMQSLGDRAVRGGDERPLLWRYEGPGDPLARIECSRDGGATWEPVGEAPATCGEAPWKAPLESCTVLLRVRAEVPGLPGAIAEGRARAVVVDAAPPRLEVGRVPERVAGELEFPLEASDPGGSGLDSVVASVRPALESREGGAAPWSPIPAERVALDPARGTIRISTAGLPEGPHEVHLSALDRAGNGGPGADPVPLGRFVIDRTPPRISAQPTAFPWVEGMLVAVQVELDLADAVPPLHLEERAPGAGPAGGWTEVLRWESFQPGGDLYRFPIPVGRSEHEVRFGIRDAAGNIAHAVVGPRPVERSIRLAPLPAEPSHPGGGSLTVSWRLHPALLERAGDLRVAAAHQPKEGADWIPLDEVPAASSWVWTLPAGDPEAHRIRVSLIHRGDLLGEDQSAPFAIVRRPEPPRIEPQVVPIAANSLYYAERGELQLEKHRQGRAQEQKWLSGISAGLRRDPQGNILPEDLEKLPPDLRRQARERERLLKEAAEKVRESFEKALELDPRNYRAAYGLAQLIQRTAPERAEEAVRHLERTVSIKADHAAALNDLGVLRILRGEHAAAEEALRSAVAVSGQGPHHYNLALALFHQKKTAEARRHFEEALTHGGSAVRPGEVYYYLVAAFLKEGQKDEARRRLDLYGPQIPTHLRDSLLSAVR